MTSVSPWSKVYPEPPTCLHTVLTSSGNAYMNWQTRIMYQTYLKHAAAPGSVMKAFTRVLHRGKDDELMQEVPTMRFDPNQAGLKLIVGVPRNADLLEIEGLFTQGW